MMKDLFDAYSLKARLFPAFIMLLPIALAVMAWAPEARWPVFSALGIGVTGALSFFLTELVRDQGKAKEPALWASWGGAPTTQLLRHRSKDVNPNLRKKWHGQLAKLAGKPLPNPASEAKAPDKADQAYEAAIFELREQNRTRELGLLTLKENISYGFRRNLWAMKPAGLTIALVATFASVLATYVKIRRAQMADIDVSLGALVPNVILLVWWLLRINPSWIRPIAVAYAERLLGTLSLIEKDEALH
jgi:hypothetical protein